MIAIDTNILVYAHRRDAEFHEAAMSCVNTQLSSASFTGLPWPCLHEFLSTVTRPNRFPSESTPIELAFKQLDAWLEIPNVHILGESPDHLETLKHLAIDGKIRGPMIHDARIASICLTNRVDVLWTADRDFSRFKSLRTTNPL